MKFNNYAILRRFKPVMHRQTLPQFKLHMTILSAHRYRYVDKKTQSRVCNQTTIILKTIERA